MKEQYALIGHPLGHSMSPFIHERLFALKGKEADYTLIDIAPEDLADRISELDKTCGFNATIPHKVELIPFLDEMAESAQRYQSVNCVANVDGKRIGYNTDCDGFLRSVEQYPLNGKVLLIGCGGVGRMMATEAVLHGADLTICEYNQELLQSVIAELKAKYPDAHIQAGNSAELDEHFDLLLNATPVGMYPKTENCPVSDALLEQCDCVFDVIYNPTATLLMKKARAMGKPATGGAAMLVWQAVKAHEIWNNDFYTNEEVQSIITEMEAEIDKNFH